MKTSTKVFIGVAVVGVGIAAYLAYKKGIFTQAAGLLPGSAYSPSQRAALEARQKQIKQEYAAAVSQGITPYVPLPTLLSLAEQEAAEAVAAEQRIAAREKAGPIQVKPAPNPGIFSTAWDYWFK